MAEQQTPSPPPPAAPNPARGYEADPANDRNFQSALLEDIMGGKAPEDEADEPAREQSAGKQGDDDGDDQDEAEEQDEDGAEDKDAKGDDSDGEDEPEEDEVEFEGEDGKPSRAKLSAIVEGYLKSLKPAAQVDEKAIRAQLKAELEREHAGKAKEISEAQAKWLERAELWSKWNGEPKPPNPDMLDPNFQGYDPDRYHRARAMYERSLAAWKQVQGDIQKVKDEAAQRQSSEFQKLREREIKSLSEKWPEFAKDSKVRDAVLATAKQYGFSPEEIGEVVDHRFFLALKDLGAYSAMKEAKGASAVKKKAAPKLVKAAARTADAGSKGGKMPAATREYLDLRKRVEKTGKIHTGAEALAFFGKELGIGKK